jgi:hypothetical protein
MVEIVKSDNKIGLQDPASVADRILIIRRHKVLLDSDLAEIYGVETKVLNQAVKRNLARFPAGFLFQMTIEETREVEGLRSQNVTLNVGTPKRGRHRKYAEKIEKLEQKYDERFKVVFSAIKQLMSPIGTQPKKIGFIVKKTPKKK